MSSDPSLRTPPPMLPTVMFLLIVESMTTNEVWLKMPPPPVSEEFPLIVHRRISAELVVEMPPPGEPELTAWLPAIVDEVIVRDPVTFQMAPPPFVPVDLLPRTTLSVSEIDPPTREIPPPAAAAQGPGPAGV